MGNVGLLTRCFGMRRYPQFFWPMLAAVAIVITGCNSGTSGPPVPSSSANLMAGASPGSATLTDPSGYGVSLTLPSTSDGSNGTIAASITTTLPTGIAAPASIRRAGRRSARSIDATLTPLVYLVLTPGATVTFSSTPGFSFTLPSAIALAAGSSGWVAFYDPALSSTGWVTILGPGAVSGQKITFPATTGNLTLKGGTSYAFVLFTTGQQPTVSDSQCRSLTPTSPPSPLPSPTPRSSNYVALQILIDKTAQAGRPCVNPNNVNIYIYGTPLAGGSPVYVTDAQGDTASVPSSGVSPIPFYASGSGTGNASQVIQVPNLNSARVYMSVNGALTVNPPNNLPAPWSLAPGTAYTPIFDWFEYTLPGNGLPSPSIVVNSTQIQMIGLDYTIQLNGTQKGSQKSGLLAGS